MATSSIFAPLEIVGDEAVERFIDALDKSRMDLESGKENKLPNNIRIVRDKAEVHRVLEKALEARKRSAINE